MRTAPARPYRDARVDLKIVLSALWVAMMFVFAYVDIFGFLRADVLKAALDGRVATTDAAVDQTFLLYGLGYVLPATLMVVLCLVLPARVNRMVNVILGMMYLISVIVSAIGEHWAYYIVGTVVEALLLVIIAGLAWRWPARQSHSPPVERSAHRPVAEHRV